MIQKCTALLAAFAVALTALAPVEAAAQRYRGGDRHYDRDHRDYRDHDRHRGYRDYRDYDRRRDWRRHRDDDNDEVAAAVIGLIVGVALGSAASQHNDRDRSYRDDRRYRDQRYSRDYRDDRYYQSGYEDAYDTPPCIRREQRWDRYANRYVTVDVPC